MYKIIYILFCIKYIYLFFDSKLYFITVKVNNIFDFKNLFYISNTKTLILLSYCISIV